LSLVAIFVTALVIQSCQQADLPIVEETIDTAALNLQPTVISLTQDDPILTALKESGDIQHYDTEVGELLWDMASLVTHESDETLPLVTIPIDNGDEGNIMMFVAAYNETDGSFMSFLNGFDLNQATSDDAYTGYTGIVEYKTVDNFDLMSMSFENGELSEHKVFPVNEVAYRCVDMGCFVACFVPLAVGVASVGGIANTCMAAYQGCLPFVSQFNPFCVTFAGCLLYWGGAVAYCAYNCRT